MFRILDINWHILTLHNTLAINGIKTQIEHYESTQELERYEMAEVCKHDIVIQRFVIQLTLCKEGGKHVISRSSVAHGAGVPYHVI